MLGIGGGTEIVRSEFARMIPFRNKNHCLNSFFVNVSQYHYQYPTAVSVSIVGYWYTDTQASQSKRNHLREEFMVTSEAATK